MRCMLMRDYFCEFKMFQELSIDHRYISSNDTIATYSHEHSIQV